MSYLCLKNIVKMYPGPVQAVFDFNLDAEPGEFIVLVGPSGCGKSTVLRMISGLEEISGGDLLLEGKRINDLAPSDRETAMVFQDYALYGNMTVYQNIGFSLTIKGEKADRIHERVMGVSKTVGIFEYLNRFPKALSGGQKQRVAMGRSLAKQTKILLMDEPLSNLDAKLRQQTRKELAMLHNELHPTIVYVTHDQTEAMTLASRIVVMNEGRIQQIGTSYEVYHFPENMFTAGFIGSPPVNLVKGRIENSRFIVTNNNQEAVINCGIPPAVLERAAGYRDGGIIMGLRPENIRPAGMLSGNSGGKPCAFRAVVKNLELLGAEYNAGLDTGGCTLTCRIPARREMRTGERLEAVFDMNTVLFFDEKTGLRIKGRDEK
jgi:multiple sugar transport system ATP-binding protein